MRTSAAFRDGLRRDTRLREARHPASFGRGYSARNTFADTSAFVLDSITCASVRL